MVSTPTAPQGRRPRRPPHRHRACSRGVIFQICSIRVRGWLGTFISHRHSVSWSGKAHGEGKKTWRIHDITTTSRGALLFLFPKSNSCMANGHPPGPFPRPLPSLPSRIVASVVVVMKRGKAGVEKGETKTRGENKREARRGHPVLLWRKELGETKPTVQHTHFHTTTAAGATIEYWLSR
jgi:hypothetical protein